MKQLQNLSCLLLLIFGLGLVVSCGSSKKPVTEESDKKTERKAFKADARNAILSPNVRLLLSKLEENYQDEPENFPSETVIRRFNLIEHQGDYFILAFITTEDDFDEAEAVSGGLWIQSDLGSIYTARIPIEFISDLSHMPGVKYIEAEPGDVSPD